VRLAKKEGQSKQCNIAVLNDSNVWKEHFCPNTMSDATITEYKSCSEFGMTGLFA